jgi:hypothetical protein
MTDEIEKRVALLERRADVFEKTIELNEKETARRLLSIESTTNDNGDKLDMLLEKRNRSEGEEEGRKDAQAEIEARRAKDENRRIQVWTTAAVVIGGLIGCLIESHWQLLP